MVNIATSNNEADFTPTKRFFVEMLTRDIDLEDAILDLLDNCLDGVARSQKKDPEDINYKNYKVDISFDSKKFTIIDNCGGIPLESADYAFRMGRPADAPVENLATVGVYGIGMKRSIFKIGRHCIINTHHHEDEGFSVIINDEWLSSDLNWRIPIQRTVFPLQDNGTSIEISNIQPAVSAKFKNKAFQVNLINKIIFAYSYIIAKGFEVKVNGQIINPVPVSLRFENSLDENSRAIQPYIYTGTIDGVDVKLIVGFYAPLVSEKEEEEEKSFARYDTKNAGWTIVCNDRIVVYRDKSELTGWGTDFARYHTQFIAISGIVYFKSREPEKLPITTTKRGVDVSSPLFLKVRKHIIEGTKLFIDYTNKWKGEDLIKSSNSRLEKSEVASPLEVIEHFEKNNASNWVNVKNRTTEKKFKPLLPTPNTTSPRRNISFSKSSDAVETVAEFLNLDDGYTYNQVGEACFDYVHTEAIK
ncbi:ATP-binding protein [Pectobacterium polonicum]|uniref:ATP-binding protein n=1 Tax=Pectobacterium polonicum TaxID=2485124 RepID=A0ABV1PA75_9GAMM|nr:ATP-binding protein [Pectobacterium polonicum]MDC9818697.1 ATP-binding protein [Pectobacterium polonicum]